MKSLVNMVDVSDGLFVGSLFSDLKIFVRRLFTFGGENTLLSMALCVIKAGEVIGDALSD